MKVLDKVWWYTNRLRSMSTPELRHRIEEYQIKRRERRMITVNGSASIPHNRDQQPQTRVAMTAGPALPHNRASLQFYALPTVTADQLPPGAVAATLATADRLLAHQITLFGHDFELGPTIQLAGRPADEPQLAPKLLRPIWIFVMA
ncbi:MAG: hypothetical protein R2932_47725 [Caldilineaceae bacterium]